MTACARAESAGLVGNTSAAMGERPEVEIGRPDAARDKAKAERLFGKR